jgi:hypothetical protein
MLEKLFEAMDEKVFTKDLKEALEAQFNDAVEIKVSEIVESKIEELNEKSEQHIEFLESKSKEYIENIQSEMVETLDKYLDRIVEEFLNETKETLDESLKVEKADMIIDAFDAMLVATGVEVSKIVEAKDNSEVETKLSESVEKYDNLIEENISLKEENEKLLKLGVINEMCEGLTLVESEKFKKLADLVNFSKNKSYVEKLETIKESVKGAETIVEAKEKVIVENVKEIKKSVSFDHLI